MGNRYWFVIVLCFCLAPIFAAPDTPSHTNPPPTRPTDPWTCFGLGSWVTMQSILNQPDGSKKVDLEKQTTTDTMGDTKPKLNVPLVVTEILDPQTRLVLKQSHTFKIDWPVVIPKGMNLQDEQTETLTIESQDFACTKRVYYQTKENGSVWRRLTLWTCPKVYIPLRTIENAGPDVPLGSDVLKAIYEYKNLNGSGTLSTEVVKLNVEHTIGTKQITCVQEKVGAMEQNTQLKLQGTGTRLLSHRVPGHKVSMDIKGTFILTGSNPSVGQFSGTHEVTAFEAKPMEATQETEHTEVPKDKP